MTHEDGHPANHRFCTLLPLVTPPGWQVAALAAEAQCSGITSVGSVQNSTAKTVTRKLCFRRPWVWLPFEGGDRGTCHRVLRPLRQIASRAPAGHVVDMDAVNHYCMVLTRATLGGRGEPPLGAPLKQFERALPHGPVLH